MSPGDAIVCELEPEDAASLSACFRRCYGETYPADLFYDPPRLAAAIASGSLRSVVAAAPDGSVIGHTGLTVRHPEAAAVEAGNTIVDPEYRGQGLLGRLGEALAVLCRAEGHIGYLHYPTTAHAIMQKRSVGGSGRETGIMLAYVPAETEYRNIDRRTGRLAATVVYQPFAPAPARAVVLPMRHRALIESLYRTLALERRPLAAGGATDRCSESVVDSRFEPRRGCLHAFVGKAGADLGPRIGSLVDRHRPAITHVDIVLDDPHIDRALHELGTLGFRYCALLPEFARTDVLRLQWIDSAVTNAFEPDLANPDAVQLLAYIAADVPRA